MQCAWLIDAISVPPLVKFVFHRERPPSAANLQLSLYHRIFFKKMQFLPKSCTISSCCVFVRPPAAVPVPQRSGSAALVNKTTLKRCFSAIFALHHRGGEGGRGRFLFAGSPKTTAVFVDCAHCSGCAGPPGVSVHSRPISSCPRGLSTKKHPRARGAGGVENPDAIAGGGR